MIWRILDLAGVGDGDLWWCGWCGVVWGEGFSEDSPLSIGQRTFRKAGQMVKYPVQLRVLFQTHFGINVRSSLVPEQIPSYHLLWVRALAIAGRGSRSVHLVTTRTFYPLPFQRPDLTRISLTESQTCLPSSPGSPKADILDIVTQLSALSQGQPPSS